MKEKLLQLQAKLKEARPRLLATLMTIIILLVVTGLAATLLKEQAKHSLSIAYLLGAFAHHPLAGLLERKIRK